MPDMTYTTQLVVKGWYELFISFICIYCEAVYKVTTKLVKIQIYTDGSSLGNPGQWWRGALIIAEGKRKSISGGEPLTTNNRMELMAVIEWLHYLKEKGAPNENIHIHLDSKYVKEGVERLKYRIQRGRRLANKKPVANRDLWEKLNELLPLFTLERHWVKWHADDELNNRVDKLARSAAAKQPKIVLPVNEKNIREKVRGQVWLFGE